MAENCSKPSFFRKEERLLLRGRAQPHSQVVFPCTVLLSRICSQAQTGRSNEGENKALVSKGLIVGNSPSQVGYH